MGGTAYNIFEYLMVYQVHIYTHRAKLSTPALLLCRYLYCTILAKHRQKYEPASVDVLLRVDLAFFSPLKFCPSGNSIYMICSTAVAISAGCEANNN